MPGGDLIQIGPADVWTAPVMIPVSAVGAVSYTPAADVDAHDALPASWVPFSDRLMRETASIMIDRGLTAFTPAGGSMPTRTYAKKLEVKLGFSKVEVPLQEVAFAAGYIGGSSAMDTAGVNATVTDPYHRGTALLDAELSMKPDNYQIERDADDTDPVVAEGYRSLILRGPSPLLAGAVLQLYIPFARHIGGVAIGPGSDEPMPIAFDFMAFDLNAGVTPLSLKHGVA